MSRLFEKYDVPGPRYTSYPTVPYWEAPPTPAAWLADLTRSAVEPALTWSLYLHLPYCESRCWFCACNAKGTPDHAVEAPYVAGLLSELDLYLKNVPALRERPLSQIHLGGGTPNFFSVNSLELLISGIQQRVTFTRGGLDASVEVNPVHTQPEQLAFFARSGFRRISFGVQDFNRQVQAAIHRIQDPEETNQLLTLARRLGFESVNFDLIYGLPHQTPGSIAETAARVCRLRPDRLALYSFALVPWVQPAQRPLAAAAPQGAAKRRLYEICRSAFLDAGYCEIGMDHFALPSDALARAAAAGSLHRNFMGYTDCHTAILLGLGASAISESPGCYHQNEKDPERYLQALQRGDLATFRGHCLTDEDRRRRTQILQLMTRFSVELEDRSQAEDVSAALAPMLQDGLATISGTTLALTQTGRPFLRNACMAFDLRLRAKEPGLRIFSQTV